MKRLLFILLLTLPLASFGQQHVLFRDSTTIDSFRLTMWVRQLIPPSVPKINPFFDSLGSAYLASDGVWWRHNGVVWEALTTDPDSAIWATNYYVDSGLASISAGAVDTNNYITSITRLRDSIGELRTYVDSNLDIIYNDISTLQTDVAATDSAVGVAFGAIATLYDTLPYYVPYTGATADVNLGSKSLTTNKVLADTLGAKSSMGIHLHGTGGKGIMVGAGGGGNITFDDYTTTTIGDSLLSTDSSGGLVRYDMKSKLLNYLLKSDSTSYYTSRGRTQKVADSLGAIIATKGTVNSVATGYGLAGGTITNTGTISADSTALATKALLQKKVDSLNAIVATKGSVTSIQLVGGTNVTITPTTAITTSGTYTISATGGGGGSPTTATNPQIPYKSGSDTLKGANIIIDSTDGQLVFPHSTDTTAVASYWGGGTKVVGTNRMGMGSIRIFDTVSIPAALQRAINVQLTSTIEPLASNTATYTGAFSLTTPPAARPTFVAGGGAATTRIASYNATQQHLNYNVLLFTTSASAGQIAGMYMTANTHLAGIICGNTKNSGGGGRGTFMFGLPTFAIGHRLFVGYTTNFTNSAADPSSFTSSAMIGLAKDAADPTLQIMHSSGGGTVTKVSTGLTASTDDLYIVTVYIAPNSTFYIQVEVRGKTSTKTFVYNPTTNVPAVGTRLEMRQLAGTGLSGGVTEFGFIKFTEEIY